MMYNDFSRKITITADLTFSSTYLVYLKLWNWVRMNKYGFNNSFSSFKFKNWENAKSNEIFRSMETNTAFGTEVIELVNCIYYFHTDSITKKNNLISKSKVGSTYVVTTSSKFTFLFIRCGRSHVLCNVFFNYIPNLSNIENYIARENIRNLVLKNDDFIRHNGNIWFINTNQPFLNYSKEILNRYYPCRKDNISFYDNFKKSFLNNKSDDNQLWNDGYFKLTHINNPKFQWRYMYIGITINTNGDKEGLFIITGFNKA